jgi:uncharacterized membrane protein (DUF485 family)
MNLHLLSRARWRVAIVLSALVVFVYFGFVLLIAFNKPFMSTLLAPGLSLGILLGALVIASAWLATWYYVRWANSHFDHHVQALRGEKRAK